MAWVLASAFASLSSIRFWTVLREKSTRKTLGVSWHPSSFFPLITSYTMMVVVVILGRRCSSSIPGIVVSWKATCCTQKEQHGCVSVFVPPSFPSLLLCSKGVVRWDGGSTYFILSFLGGFSWCHSSSFSLVKWASWGDHQLWLLFHIQPWKQEQENGWMDELRRGKRNSQFGSWIELLKVMMMMMMRRRRRILLASIDWAAMSAKKEI